MVKTIMARSTKSKTNTRKQSKRSSGKAKQAKKTCEARLAKPKDPKNPFCTRASKEVYNGKHLCGTHLNMEKGVKRTSGPRKSVKKTQTSNPFSDAQGVVQRLGMTEQDLQTLTSAITKMVAEGLGKCSFPSVKTMAKRLSEVPSEPEPEPEPEPAQSDSSDTEAEPEPEPEPHTHTNCVCESDDSGSEADSESEPEDIEGAPSGSDSESDSDSESASESDSDGDGE